LTYFGILATFIIPPLLILLALVPRDVWRWLIRREGRVNWKPYLVIVAHVALALVYTTPWDNYLVATGVWWYNPQLVTGISLGWVPIEEYTFFVVQTLLTGLWTLALMRLRLDAAPGEDLNGRRAKSLVPTLAVTLVASLWLVSTFFLVQGPASLTYLTLILSWALIPVVLQLAFGADILLANWRLLLAAILPPTLYLWLVDALAITGGTWTIDPAQTTGVKVGPLPLEEMAFFLMTNLIIAFGMTLMLSEASQRRARALLARLKGIKDAGTCAFVPGPTPEQTAHGPDR
jgi:lycopene cyclase domain-containing protein